MPAYIHMYICALGKRERERERSFGVLIWDDGHMMKIIAAGTQVYNGQEKAP